jgi:hypothetical protein
VSEIRWIFSGIGVLVLGFLGRLLVRFWNRRKRPVSEKPVPTPRPPVSVTQENKQEFYPQFNPQLNISVGTTAAVAPTPAPKKTDEPRCNIRFKDVKLGSNPIKTFPFTPDFIFSAAVFENEVLPTGERLHIPYVKARAIYRHPDDFEILDLPNAAWIPGEGRKYEKFEVNTPKYLLLFAYQDGKLRCRSAEPINTRMAGKHRRICDYQDFEIPLRVSSVEIQLLTESELLYRVLLTFDDKGNGLPAFTGFREL